MIYEIMLVRFARGPKRKENLSVCALIKKKREILWNPQIIGREL
jgi:hypothetical protein